MGTAPRRTAPLPLSRASSAPSTRLLRATLCLSSSARAKPASFTCICGRGRASPLSLAASTASDSSSSCRFSSRRALRVPSSVPARVGLSAAPCAPLRLRLRLLHSPSASRSALREKASSRWVGSLRLPLRLRSFSSLFMASRASLSWADPLRSNASSPWAPLAARVTGTHSPGVNCPRSRSSLSSRETVPLRSSRTRALASTSAMPCRLICQGCLSLAAGGVVAAGSEVASPLGSAEAWSRSLRLELPSALVWINR